MEMLVGVWSVRSHRAPHSEVPTFGWMFCYHFTDIFSIFEQGIYIFML